MDNFQLFLTEFERLKGYDEILISHSLAADPSVAKYCEIDQGNKTGRFMGKQIRVVPDMAGANFQAEREEKSR